MVFRPAEPHPPLQALSPNELKRLRFHSGFQEAKKILIAKEVFEVEQKTNERQLKLRLSEDCSIEIQLIPARPNVVVSEGSQIKFALNPIQALEPRVVAIALPVHVPSGSDAILQSWMHQRYAQILNDLQQALIQSIFQSIERILKQRLNELLRIEEQNKRQIQASVKYHEVFEEANRLKGSLHLEKDPDAPFKMQKLYQQAKKLKRTGIEIGKRQLEIQRKIEFYQKIGFQRDNWEMKKTQIQNLWADFQKWIFSIPDFQNLRATPAINLDKLKKAKQLKKISKNLLNFISKEGLQIWIGRHHEENEELVQRLAKGNDVWFHLKGRPGAHGLIQLPKGKNASLDSLLDAATLVAHYSNVKGNEKADVDYTFRKYVKRVPSKKEGQFLVTYSQNKTLHVQADENRLKRLFSTQS